MNVLICGYGKMGKLYGKYLDKHQIKWKWYDPCLNNGVSYPTQEIFSHIIISSPVGAHVECYEKFKNNGKLFLVEKPVISSRNEMFIFDNPVSSGMVERFNPVINILRDNINYEKVVCVDFSRCNKNQSAHDVLDELAIHDLDLYCYLFDLDFPKYFRFDRKKTSISLVFNDAFMVRFFWQMESMLTKTGIVVHQEDASFVCDLREQSIIVYNKDDTIELDVEKKQPLEQELLAFLRGNMVSAKKSHEFMLQLKDIECFA